MTVDRPGHAMRPTKQRYRRVSETDPIPNPTQREPERLATNASSDRE